MIASEAIEWAAALLGASGVPEPRRDAERLLQYVGGWDAAGMIVHSRDALPPADIERFEHLVEQRVARRPIQHLIGVAPFWRHELRVTPDVLIPRPETEHLVEAALDHLAPLAEPVVADVGTGSGCIALAIAAERADVRVHAIDLSPAALAVARENAQRLGLGERVRFHEGDLLEPLDGLAIDLVASNPPYVADEELAALAPEVRDHDPRMALVPPGDRYSVYRRLAEQARTVLKPHGTLMVEIGQGMDAEVVRILEAAGFAVERSIADLQGIPRVVIARAPAAAARG